MVEDGSPDGCGKICDAYALKDPRIIVIHKTNGGLSSARNAGLDICTGSYVGFIDGDDYIAPDFYEILSQKLTATDSSFVGARFTAVINGIARRCVPALEYVYTDKEKYIQDLFTKLLWEVSVCNKLFDSEIFRQLRFREGKIHEDNFIVLDIIKRCRKNIAFTDKTEYFCVSRRGSIMTKTFIFSPFDAIEANQYNLSILRSSFPALVSLGEYALFCTYRTVLDRIIIFSDWQEHQAVINLLRQNISSHLSILRSNKYFTFLNCNNKLNFLC